MKKILLIAILTLPVMACQTAGTIIKSVGETGACFAIGSFASKGAVALAIPNFAIEASRGQATYNKANGIHHSRGERKDQKK